MTDGDDLDRSDACRALLTALEELVGEVGPRSVGLRAVARRAGLSHSAPGHCFGDLEGMFAAFAREGFAKLTTTLAQAAGSEQPPPEQVRAVCVAYVGFARTHPAHFDAMFRIGLNKSDHPELQAKANNAFGYLSESVTAWQRASSPTTDIETATLQVWSLAHGLANLAVDGQLDSLFPHKSIDTLVTEVVHATTNPS